MCQNTPELVNSDNEIESYKHELINLLNILKEKNEDLNNCIGEFNSIKKEINSVKEINNKTKDFLLLELESNLDKQKELQYNYKSDIGSFKEIIELLKEEKNNNLEEISTLNVEIGKCKQLLDDKNNLIESLRTENDKLRYDLSENKDNFNLLENELNNVKESHEQNLINNISLNEKINVLNESISSKDESISSLNAEVGSLRLVL